MLSFFGWQERIRSETDQIRFEERLNARDEKCDSKV